MNAVAKKGSLDPCSSKRAGNGSVFCKDGGDEKRSEIFPQSTGDLIQKSGSRSPLHSCVSLTSTYVGSEKSAPWTTTRTNEEESKSFTRRNAMLSFKSRCATAPCSDEDTVVASDQAGVSIENRADEGPTTTTTTENKHQQATEIFDRMLPNHRLNEMLGPEEDYLVRRPANGMPRVGRYRLTRRLGEGAYGQVWEAEDTTMELSSADEATTVAIKIISKSSSASQKRMDMIADEITIMRRLDHKNVISAKEVLHGREHIFVVMELAYMTVDEYRDEYGDTLEHRCIRSILKGVLDGIAHLHDNGVAHMDLKSENIMIVRDVPPERLTPDDIRICDLGFSVIGDRTGKVTSRSKRGTVGLMAPEVHVASDNAAPYNAKPADIWSLGIVLVDLLGCTSYTWMDLFKKQNSPVFEKLLNKKMSKLHSTLKQSKHVDTQLSNLVVSMLRVSPNERLTAHAALAHPWVSRPPERNFFQVVGALFSGQ